ncbi:chloramphenicol O-acetyltransferase type A [Aquiflexum balticum DSM 16537]|uniref:Chloramphenicol O-acetyltransferase type A n=1 Tax=Aquiflexum balticum DSM 16537 TaxID=758820 RepID=A0A1W2H6V3_9BACT|nr:chloramphenicol acetyltransferase [Aquiflexum balticum]SMD44675.1 chloramphenicol O-acetyltransferase type A [Aquiflexum balticum DSM 16537]
MYRILDIEKWSRKDHFLFFSKFEEPFFGVTVRVNCTKAYNSSKSIGSSFFLYYLHASLQAANSIEAFKYRIKNGQVLIYDKINASPTINRDNGTFGFSYMDYLEDFKEFEKSAKIEIEKVRNTTGLDPAGSGDNVIHFSSIPWIDFTSISHARSFSFPDSCPKISFGQVIESEGIKTMPVSIHVHHALMDGIHVGQFIELFQKLLDR